MVGHGRFFFVLLFVKRKGFPWVKSSHVLQDESAVSAVRSGLAHYMSCFEACGFLMSLLSHGNR